MGRTTQSQSSMRAPPQMQMTPSRLCVPTSESDSTVVYRRNDCILILLAPACACGGSSQHVSQETDKTDHACQPCLDVEAQLCATSTAWGQYFSDMFVRQGGVVKEVRCQHVQGSPPAPLP